MVPQGLFGYRIRGLTSFLLTWLVLPVIENHSKVVTRFKCEAIRPPSYLVGSQIPKATLDGRRGGVASLMPRFGQSLLVILLNCSFRSSVATSSLPNRGN